MSSNVATTKQLSDVLELMDAHAHLTMLMGGYSGRAQPDLWEWLAAKSKTNG